MTKKQLDHLMAEVQKDDLYQDFLHVVDICRTNYLRIREKLSFQDQRLLEHYISASTGLEEQVARTAYFLTPLEDTDEYDDEDEEYDE